MFLNDEGNKVIPSNFGDHLTPRSLAFWIMDDGQRVKRGGVTLCTDSYNQNEIQILRDVLFILKKIVLIILFMKEYI